MMINIPKSAVDVVQGDVSAIAHHASDSLDMLAGQNVLLTGGAGFLGYMLAHVLAQVGDSDGRSPIQLTIYENFSRGRKLWLENLCARPNVTLVEHDITRPLPGGGAPFSYIIHAASIASPTYYRLHPIETIDANVNGLRHLLDYAKLRAEGGSPISGMLFFSTSEIYGDPFPDAIPTAEAYRGFVSCTGPRACYDESKRLGETLCVNFAQQHGVPVTIARPFNNYGPGLDIHDRRLLPDLARDMFEEKDLILLSDGSATRTFCYISDAIAGYIKILTKGRAGEPYNIGTESPEINVRQLADRVAAIGHELFGYTGRVVHKNSDDIAYLTDNPNRRCPNIAKARSELGYVPRVSLEEGLRRSLIWYRENR
ncbi:MAG: NAD-dependent epimerase/dehydratase family protein [Candidatus Accumulibacter sp.]|uniref:NAD-dependent epimerase/dehydratase family protein n=1 Tax=Accumulibacter sp. TaxID=2053492 RepID=UPI00287A6061|nr:NAD-dependent epimerase/dehydratase family protein [Accumulibacter sp.]MDS4016646.1 NAD-dependent epimerase/dehydratase family protein [Accumulibacter sp.]